MYSTLQAFQSEHNLFVDDSRSDADNQGPHILIVDDFYDAPDEIRELALSKEYVQYSPPLPEQVGESVASEPQFEGVTGRMLSTALYTFRGIPVFRPFNGFRYNPETLKNSLENLIGERIDPSSWEPGGDGWNGAFHLRESGNTPLASVHHHYHKTNTVTRGWSGVCYLSPDPVDGSGTSFWRDKATGKCIAQFGETFRRDEQNFEKIFEPRNVYNRLVLFRENVLHKIENGFGSGKSARMTQTFFFQCQA